MKKNQMDFKLDQKERELRIVYWYLNYEGIWYF